MSTTQQAGCGCVEAPAPAPSPRLETLVPIAVVIAAGCEPCAERMVKRALDEGASPRDVRKTLGIVADLRRRDCLAEAVGADVIARMERPLARGLETLEAERIVERVRERYAGIAVGGADGCGCSPTGAATSTTRQLARELGYEEDELARVPDEANLGLGCGAPVELLGLRAGETVLDLGSGGGLDAILAAPQVGPEGKVIGVDMTPEMIERARGNVRRANLPWVEFRLGRLERLPLPDRSVDAVTSNCVINLVPDKGQVFREIARVLRPGGRLVISDIVRTGALPGPVERDILAWVGCVAGALEREEYFSQVRRAGLTGLEVLRERDLAGLAEGLLPDELVRRLRQAGVGLDDLRGKLHSVTFRARRR